MRGVVIRHILALGGEIEVLVIGWMYVDDCFGG